jgi:hypothetical protein
MLAIIGFGISGMLVYLELLNKGVSASNILIIDRDFSGGDLSTLWYSINSNTVWKQVKDALNSYELCNAVLSKFNHIDDSITSLIELPKILRTSINNSYQYKQSEIHATFVSSLTYSSDSKKWSIETPMGVLIAEGVFLCYGGEPKTLDIPTRWIPLSIALNKDSLKKHVEPGATYAVFGTSHSGTLILKNLTDCGVKAVGIYKTPKPFQYARDNVHGGIKQESAQIADDIIADKYPDISLLQYNDIGKVLRTVQKADACVCAIGFQPREIPITVDTNKKSSRKYSPESAKIDDCPNLYGFGMAFPGVTVIDGKIYEDISLPSFQLQISRCIPEILNQL